MRIGKAGSPLSSHLYKVNDFLFSFSSGHFAFALFHSLVIFSLAPLPDHLQRESFDFVDCSACFFHDPLLKQCFPRRLQRATEPKTPSKNVVDGVDENARFSVYLATRGARRD